MAAKASQVGFSMAHPARENAPHAAIPSRVGESGLLLQKTLTLCVLEPNADAQTPYRIQKMEPPKYGPITTLGKLGDY